MGIIKITRAIRTLQVHRTDLELTLASMLDRVEINMPDKVVDSIAIISKFLELCSLKKII